MFGLFFENCLMVWFWFLQPLLIFDILIKQSLLANIYSIGNHFRFPNSEISISQFPVAGCTPSQSANIKPTEWVSDWVVMIALDMTRQVTLCHECSFAAIKNYQHNFFLFITIRKSKIFLVHHHKKIHKDIDVHDKIINVMNAVLLPDWNLSIMLFLVHHHKKSKIFLVCTRPWITFNNHEPQT